MTIFINFNNSCNEFNNQIKEKSKIGGRKNISGNKNNMQIKLLLFKYIE